MYRDKGKMWDQIGEYLVASPDIPKDKSGFLNPVTPRQSAQKFEHTPDLPTAAEYGNWPKHRQQELANREWHRRTHGVWFWNNGVATWIPGPYYFFLNYHRFKDQKPQYRNAHRQLYWVWCQFVLTHRNCLGLFLHTRRRWGKTACAASIGNDAVSGTANFHFGIQSKDEQGASSLFIRDVQTPLRQMLAECPWFYQHTAGSNKPQREFLFDKPGSKKAGAAADTDNLGGLNSRVDWLAGTGVGYDSEALDYYVNDEVGKEQRGNPWARHSVVSKQFYPNGIVVGKEFAMTTSDEDQDDAVAMAKLFWDESDPALLDQRKGLARLFFPDTQGFMVDEYGYDTPESLADLDAERAAARAAGPEAWLRRRRAFPRSIEEAHLPNVKTDCLFNQAHIGDCQTAIAEYDGAHAQPLVRRYRLYGEPGNVAVTEDPNGRFYLSWIPPADWLNKIKQVGTVQTAKGIMPRYKPEGTRFGASADPFDNTTTLKEGSKGAGHLAYEWDSQMEDKRGQPGYWPSHGFIGEYAERPDDPDVYYHDMLLLCWWAGCKLFCETNKVNLEKYFRLMGCGDFLARQPVATMSEQVRQAAKDPTNVRTGMASSPRAIEEYTKAKIVFYQKYVGGPGSQDSVGNPCGPGFNDDGVPYDFRRMPFLRTMTQDIAFNPADPAIRKKSDLSVSHGFGLVQMTGLTLKPRLAAPGGVTLQKVNGLLGSLYR